MSHIYTVFAKIQPTDVRLLSIQIKLAIENNDLELFLKLIKSLFDSIPYQLHINKEAYYHSLFYLVMELVGIDMAVEQSTAKGRIDGVIESGEFIYIIEFKYINATQKGTNILNSAIKQIKTNECFSPFTKKNKPIKYLAIAIGKGKIEHKISE